MDERESMGHAPSHDSTQSWQATPAGATGSLPQNAVSAASSTGSFDALPTDADKASLRTSLPDPAVDSSSNPAPRAPRYVRQRAPHRSQGTVDDLNEDSIPQASYTHDSNISVGGATPLSGMAYRRSRSNISRVKNGSRYGQYLEIPKGRRSIFASRERARRRRSVIALVLVVALLILAAALLWGMMQKLMG